VTSSWVAAPTFVDEASRERLQFPEIDLRKGDMLKIRAPECTEYAKLKPLSMGGVAAARKQRHLAHCRIANDAGQCDAA
jgi:hypothetical protein